MKQFLRILKVVIVGVLKVVDVVLSALLDSHAEYAAANTRRAHSILFPDSKDTAPGIAQPHDPAAS